VGRWAWLTRSSGVFFFFFENEIEKRLPEKDARVSCRLSKGKECAVTALSRIYGQKCLIRRSNG
jgi:hypothetical protein